MKKCQSNQFDLFSSSSVNVALCSISKFLFELL